MELLIVLLLVVIACSTSPTVNSLVIALALLGLYLAIGAVIIGVIVAVGVMIYENPDLLWIIGAVAVFCLVSQVDRITQFTSMKGHKKLFVSALAIVVTIPIGVYLGMVFK